MQVKSDRIFTRLLFRSQFAGPVVSSDSKSFSWQLCWTVLFCCGEWTLLLGCSSLEHSFSPLALQQIHNCCKLLFDFFTLCVVGHTLMASICVLGVDTHSSRSSSSILINTEPPLYHKVLMLQLNIKEDKCWKRNYWHS